MKHLLLSKTQIMEPVSSTGSNGMTSRGLTRAEAYLLVTKFIGVPGNDLNIFTHRSLREFLEFECGVTEDVLNKLGGTKRAVLEGALEAVEPRQQAVILRGIVGRAPSGIYGPDEREHIRPKIQEWIARLESSDMVSLPEPPNPSDEVQKALHEARTLIDEHGADAALDRIHTAMHGYLRDECDRAGITYPADPTIMSLYRNLRETHAQMAPPAGWEKETDLILKTQAGVLDSYNKARNNASGAHPSPRLPDAEAELFLNAASTLFRYVHAKLA